MPDLVGNSNSKDLFLKIGLDEKSAQNAIANGRVTTNLTAVISEVATKFPNNALKHRPTLLGYITSGKVKSIPQVEAAFAFLSKVGPERYDSADLAKACGVGDDRDYEEVEEPDVEWRYDNGEFTLAIRNPDLEK